ncbi:MAG: saccharopine dehydrogenase NADP-binding domain-containing protein [Bacteroidetes bacterium]|nr:saccharopine dehydrogenase NADP-binding domain-containing protein [Bacteroidota bacterium]
MKIAVLGAGMVGSAMAIDLSHEYQVTSFDKNVENLRLLQAKNGAIMTQETDLSDFSQYGKIFADFDLLITAVPGFMGYNVLKAAIEAGKNIADISFFPENALELDALAKEKNVTVITDIGVAPGMSNLILGKYNKEMEVSLFECYVGGLPKTRRKPFEYKAPFSPVDVIEEYTRPARLKENGVIVIKPALSEREYMDFHDIGTLEAFNTDGLRSILFTMEHIPTLKEKTLRYPGHIDLIIALKQSGFFNTEKIQIDGHAISPLAFSSKILFNDWKLGAEEEELTIMKVFIHGNKKGQPTDVLYTLLDRYDNTTKTSSMARTTGYTCTAAANLILKNKFIQKGVFPPELVGNDDSCFEFILQYLKERNVLWKKEI